MKNSQTPAIPAACPPGATVVMLQPEAVALDADASADRVVAPAATVLCSERMVECMKKFDKILRQTRNTLTFGGKDMPNCCNLVAEKMSDCVYCCSVWEHGRWQRTPSKFYVGFQACEHCKSPCELVGEFIDTLASIVGTSTAGSVAG
jgi:hypothetical protein